ncbi:MAG: nodulation protein NodH [Paracoccaceae bacterium]|nr:MAG: nodulation protein NodH [Paracoccaceae bacterium]
MARFDSFVMFAAMRTGSNFLEANLNALPGVTCHGEAFNPHFIGKLNQAELFDITLAARDADPGRLLRAMRDRTPGLSGFRYFHDHDPRVFDPVMQDARCAKIVLTRNPLESYVSLKIAQATGQWKLTNAKRLKTAQARFDGAEFEAFIAELQAFHLRILHGLQTTGQTAFYIDYEDLQDLDVLNGLAAHLGIAARLDAPDPTLKKQNPEPIEDKVENPEQMVAALSGIDRFDLSRTPSFEPRRAPAIPSYHAAGPMLYMPVPGGPVAQVKGWLAGFGAVRGDFTHKTLRQWMRNTPAHRSFTVLRHPLLRAHAVFRTRILTGAAPELRGALNRTFALDLPPPHKAGAMSPDDHRAAFLAFLRFARMILSGQTSLRVDGQIATQTALIQGFAQHQAPDAILREDRLAQGLAFLCAETGVACPDLPPSDDPQVIPLSALRTAEIDAAAREAYQRDYIGFGFGDAP